MTVLTLVDLVIDFFFQKLKEETSDAKKQLFEEESSSSSSTEATKIDKEGMTKVAQTMAELVTGQGTIVSQPNQFPLMGPQKPQPQPIHGSKYQGLPCSSHKISIILRIDKAARY